MLTARNIEAGSRVYDIWQVNEDAEYHESGDEGEVSNTALTSGEKEALASTRDVPTRIESDKEDAGKKGSSRSRKVA